MRRRFLFYYIKTIRRSINLAKLKDIQKYQERADYPTVVTLQADFEGDIQYIVNHEYERCFDNETEDVDILKDLSDRVDTYQDQIQKILEKIDDVYEVKDYHVANTQQMQSEISFLKSLLNENQLQKYNSYLSGAPEEVFESCG